MRKTLLLLLLLFIPFIGTSQPRGQIVSIDNSVFVVMVNPIIEGCISVQEKDNWCWAACIEMIARYSGINTTQSSIVTKVYGAAVNKTASANEIVQALNGWNGFKFRQFTNKTTQNFIEEITYGYPLIVGLSEHAYLLTHIYCNKKANGALHPFKVILINPKTGKEEVYDWEDFFFQVNSIIYFR